MLVWPTTRIFAFAALSAVATTIQQPFLDAEWELFKTTHGKSYPSPQEDFRRKEAFARNLELIIKHNEKYHEGRVSYKLAMNRFGDMTQIDFKRAKERNLPLEEGNRFVAGLNLEEVSNESDLPDEVDWRKEGAVTPVPDQGQCYSSYAFSATGALESQMFRKTGKLVSLSAQNIVDCGHVFGNRNCEGGFMDSSFGYIKLNGGIDNEESYPYIGTQGDCAFDQTEIAATVSGFVNIRSATELTLKTKLAQVGPLCAFIDNRHPSFRFYSEGVYHEPRCSQGGKYHAVLIVGYGATDKGEKYWIIRNSWGTNWGQEGYMLLKRDAHNECGIGSFVTYPVI